ncbi:MAG: type II secretion system F family protein, partial [Cyanobacteria bacterium NC_groundwater_1444_Ag_S-0.65um_54_12]|nr:type II secretion system F family protein [Cyanobacteria bacterium NC_groundwater_1444_Ag_S-0.65um_54_12]
MPKQYEYVAHAGNAIRREVIEAESEKAVRAKLREQGLFPIEIKLVPQKRTTDVMAKVKAALKPIDDGKKKVDVKPTEKKEFLYSAVPQSGGDEMRGEVTVVNERQVRQHLRERSLYPTKVKNKPFYHDFIPSSNKIAEGVENTKHEKISLGSPFESLLDRILPRFFSTRKIPLKETVFYVQQLSTMMEAGLSISQTMEILNGNIKNRRLLMINQDVQSKIFEGISLADAYAEHKSYLPDVFVELMAVGEQSGNMEETTRRLSEYLEKTSEIHRKVKGAMTYPTVLIALIVLIVLGLLFFVVPTFIKLF